MKLLLSKLKKSFFKLFGRPDDPDELMDGLGENEWVYFRRTNPGKFEVNTNEDFSVKKSGPTEELNIGELLPPEMTIKADDFLCLHLKTGMKEFIYVRDELTGEMNWISKPEQEFEIWDCWFLARGEIKDV